MYVLFIDFDLGNVRSWYMFQTKIEKLNFSILMGHFLNKKLNGNRTTDNCLQIMMFEAKLPLSTKYIYRIHNMHVPPTY